MSLNRVLNRPLFRQQALRKGALKPIKAKIGQFMMGPVTQNTTGQVARNFPLALNQQGFYGRNVRPFFQRAKADVRNFPSTAVQQVTKPRVRVPFGMGGGLGGLLGYEGLYSGVSGLTTKLGMQPGMAKNVVDFGLTTAGMFNPYTRALGLGITGLKAARALGSPVIDYFGQERGLKPGDTRKALTVDLGKPLFSDVFKPRNPEEIAKQIYQKDEKDSSTQIASGRGVGNYDSLTQPENETQVGNNTVVDLNKVVKNTSFGETPDSQGPMPSGIDGGLSGPVGIEGQNISSKPPAPVKEIKKPKGKKLQAEQDANEIIKKQSPFAKQIEMAREIQSELLQGRSSMAKQVFLSQLAAGLMAGTTRKSGIGGALEVFGQALGPAVNNYAVMKLKENELENELMSDALEMSSDFLKAQNSVMADAQDHGFVKIIGAEGQLRNMAAKRLKDGTIQVAVPGQVDANGAQLFTTVPYGSYTGFVKGDFAATEQNKTLKNLSGAYKGLQFNQINLKILREAKANDRVLAGPVGKLKLLTNRVSGAANDFGFSLGSSDKDAKDFFENNFLSEENIKSYAEKEGYSIDEAEKKLRSDFEKNKEKYKKDLEKYVKPSNQSESAQLEELAINQTITVYALANALKSKDRLTQKDIENAERLVNIFPGFKGQEQVIQSLEAIEKTLLKDIERIEGDYVDADFGDPVIIETYRRKFNIGGTGLITSEAIIDKQASQGTLLQEFNK